ncbi:MAG: alpha/beta hydrolase [Alphaproteobacteria bacterium]|nr:alpha/beta hydrolase [Alphaproteobacteria bacterium]
MSKIKSLMAGCAAALLSGCSPFGPINLLVPKSGYAVHRALSYGSDPRQKLDIYVPAGAKGPMPVLLFLYGGSWRQGNRSDYLAFGQAFSSAGMVVAVADYRLYPQVKYPGFAEDAAGALAFLHNHAAQYGGDPGRIFVSGHSAGAYNAVMLASEPKFIEAKGGRLGWIRGVIGLSGPYDFLPMTEPVYIDMFEGTNNLDSMPLHHVNGVRQPMLLATGTDDSTVDQGNTDRMAAKLKSFGSEVKVIKYKGTGHIGIILSLVPGFRKMTTLRQDMIDFIRSH